MPAAVSRVPSAQTIPPPATSRPATPVIAPLVAGKSKSPARGGVAGRPSISSPYSAGHDDHGQQDRERQGREDQRPDQGALDPEVVPVVVRPCVAGKPLDPLLEDVGHLQRDRRWGAPVGPAVAGEAL